LAAGFIDHSEIAALATVQTAAALTDRTPAVATSGRRHRTKSQKD
jgi:hypothetical protein